MCNSDTIDRYYEGYPAISQTSMCYVVTDKDKLTFIWVQ